MLYLHMKDQCACSVNDGITHLTFLNSSTLNQDALKEQLMHMCHINDKTTDSHIVCFSVVVLASFLAL